MDVEANKNIVGNGFMSAPVILLFSFIPLIPFIIMAFPSLIHQNLLFLHKLNNPFSNLRDLRRCGVKSRGRNFYLTNGDVKLGLWHILPETVSDEAADEETLFDLGNDQHPIVLYLHGNAFNRATSHRVEIYNVLSASGYHVVAVDYRGYGDSSGIPSEAGVVSDVVFTYNWIKQRCRHKPIYIWGHSLGTAIGARAVAELCDSAIGPTGFFMEAPFNNLHDVVNRHPITLPFRQMPYFDRIFVVPFESIDITMRTDENINRIKCPIIILHAKDDAIVPFDLGRKLYESAKTKGLDVEFFEFDRSRSFGHKYICRAVELQKIIADFTDACRMKMSTGPDASSSN